MTTPTVLSSPRRLPATATLLSLPEEVLTLIVASISDACLLELGCVCKKLNRICSSPLEMRQRCMRLRWWEERHDMDRKKVLPHVGDVNWRELFLYRMRVGRATSHFLAEIIAHPTHHISYFNRIVKYGYDAKDCLYVHAEVADDEVDDPLARRYQATVAIRYIHRRRALAIWNRVVQHDDVPAEVALLALDLFVTPSHSPDVADISSDFDNMAAAFLASIAAAGLDFAALDVEGKSVKLITWMWDQGFRGVSAGKYRALKNAFISLTIRTVRTAIPLTLVAIFIALARRLGLVAHPCGYPGHFLAIVEDEAGQFQYYDVFTGPGIYPRLDRSSLAAALDDPDANQAYLSPMPVALLVIRSAQNILHILQMSPGERAVANSGYVPVCTSSALYAALTALVVLKPVPVSLTVVDHMTKQIPSEFPMDVRFLEEELLPRVYDWTSRSLLERVCNALLAGDTTARAISPRNAPENECVRHRVGTVFRHRRYEYTAAIFGWTNECRPAGGEDWIQDMSVESLPRGRKQPFYHVLVDDGSVRYVAEENVCPITPPEVSGAMMELAGKYFKRFDRDKGRFVSNMLTEFPDD